MTEERPESINFRRMESQNSFDRNIDEITRASVQSATMDHTTPSPKKRILRREGTFSIYDSGKQKTNNKLMTWMEIEANANATKIGAVYR